MPKKFSTENTKAVAAREKKKQAKESEDLNKQKEEQDAEWKDNDKQLQKKLQKKLSEERKRQEALQRKAERKSLLEKEMAEVSGKSKSLPKLTRAQLETAKDTENKLKEKEKKVISHLDLPLVENLNRIHCDGSEARSIDEAIAILSTEDKTVDRHPEKRIKAAYKKFEERKLKELKIEKAMLTLSQMKEIVFKEWQKSAENPVNVR